MKYRKIQIAFVFFLIICMISFFTGCAVIKEIKKAWEEADYFVSDYDEGLKSLDSYEDTKDLALFMTIPEIKLESLIGDTTGTKKEITDSFNNTIELNSFSSKNSNKQVLYANIILKSGVYNKDKLDCILKDTKMILDDYNDSSSQLLIVFRDTKKFISWYTFIDNVEDTNMSIICCADYISYIKEVYTKYFSVENNEYYYQCKIPLDVYEIDINSKIKEEQFTSADEQIRYKQIVSSDIVNCLDYWTMSYDFDYKIYPDDEKSQLTVIMYPEEGKNNKDNMYPFWIELISCISVDYEHYTLIRELSKDGKVVHDIRDGEEKVYKLDDKKWFG